MYIIDSMDNVEYKYTEDKAELLVALNEDQDCVVILGLLMPQWYSLN